MEEEQAAQFVRRRRALGAMQRDERVRRPRETLALGVGKTQALAEALGVLRQIETERGEAQQGIARGLALDFRQRPQPRRIGG